MTKRPYGIIEPPSHYATLATWERHLADMRKLPDWALEKQSLITQARQMIALKKTAKQAKTSRGVA